MINHHFVASGPKNLAAANQQKIRNSHQTQYDISLDGKN